MNENLAYLIEKGVIVQLRQIVEKTVYYIICQKCKKKTRIKNIKKLPTTCARCKCDPYTGPGKIGRPQKVIRGG